MEINFTSLPVCCVLTDSIPPGGRPIPNPRRSTSEGFFGSAAAAATAGGCFTCGGFFSAGFVSAGFDCCCAFAAAAVAGAVEEAPAPPKPVCEGRITLRKSYTSKEIVADIPSK